MNQPVMLEVAGVSKTFGGLKAVDNVSLSVQAGALSALTAQARLRSLHWLAASFAQTKAA
jgi:ABC-type phosphonate transport system ATPase subunit